MGVLLLIGLSACSGTPDAYFVNPCSVSVRIHTFGAEDEQPFKRIALEPTSMTHVEEPFPNTRSPWRVQMAWSSASIYVDPWGWDEEDPAKKTIIIPAHACPNG